MSGTTEMAACRPGTARHPARVVPGEVSALLVVAQRDVVKLLRDRTRLVVSLAFPVVVIAGLGGALQPSLNRAAGIGSTPLLVSGVLAATLFQSAAAGMLSLIQDRETDFARELFIAPVSRLVIVSGKVLGESLVALVQGAGIVAFAAAVGVRMSPLQLGLLAPAMLVSCVVGAAFGLATLAALPNQRAGLQVLPFLVLPQYFAAGVLGPVSRLPGYLAALSWIMPLRYTVDLTRAALFAREPSASAAVGTRPLLDVPVVAVTVGILLIAGAVVLRRRDGAR